MHIHLYMMVTYIRTYMHIRTLCVCNVCTYVRMYACMYIRNYNCMYAFVYVRIYVCSRVYTHTCAYINKHV